MKLYTAVSEERFGCSFHQSFRHASEQKRRFFVLLDWMISLPHCGQQPSLCVVTIGADILFRLQKDFTVLFESSII